MQFFYVSLNWWKMNGCAIEQKPIDTYVIIREQLLEITVKIPCNLDKPKEL